jgi:Mg2+ and Co2+ transporter CorA
VAEGSRWIDLIDPTAEALRAHLPEELHPAALELLLTPLAHGDEPRPRIESHGHYVVGVLLVAIAVPDEDRIYYQEVDFILTPEQLVTVSNTPPGEKPRSTRGPRRMDAGQTIRSACSSTGSSTRLRSDSST